MSWFCSIKCFICLKLSSQLAALHSDGKILSCYSDIKSAFMKHFAFVLAGSKVDPAATFVHYLHPDLNDLLVECPSCDISDTAKSGNLLSGPGSDIFRYIVYKPFPHLLEALRPAFYFAACNSPPLQWFVHLAGAVQKQRRPS